MNTEQLYIELINLTKSLDIKLLYDKEDYDNGLCKVKGKYYIYLNKTNSFEQNTKILAESLISIGLDNIYMKPVLRDFFENYTKSDYQKIQTKERF
jgi:hypothetical protein